MPDFAGKKSRQSLQISDILAVRHFEVLWACLDMPDHIQQKLCNHSVASIDV